MKKFFTQPIGDLSRQNALTFLVINVVFIGVEFSGVTALDAVDDLLNFFWGFSLIAIITAGYYLAEGHVPEYWQPATTVLAGTAWVTPRPTDKLTSARPSSNPATAPSPVEENPRTAVVSIPVRI